MRSYNVLRCLASSAALALLLSTVPVLAAGVPVDEASWADTQVATEQYKSGKSAFDQGNLEEALARFQASYDTVASPNSHLMIARVLIELQRHVAAYEELALVIGEAEAVKKNPEKYAKTADAARALRSELEKKLGFVTVEVPAKVKIKGEDVAVSQWGTPIPVVAGTTAVEVEMADGSKRSEQLSVPAGKTTELEISPPPAAPPAPTTSNVERCVEREGTQTTGGTIKQQTVAYAAGGIGAAGLLTFTVFGILDNKRFNDLETQCVGGACPADLADDAERGRSYQALANVGLGVGVVGIGAGAVLLATAPRRERVASRTRRPQLLVGPGSVAVKGRF